MAWRGTAGGNEIIGSERGSMDHGNPGSTRKDGAWWSRLGKPGSRVKVWGVEVPSDVHMVH